MLKITIISNEGIKYNPMEVFNENKKCKKDINYNKNLDDSICDVMWLKKSIFFFDELQQW